jgi:hypothetical protein
MNPNTQSRIMRTYEVTLIDPDAPITGSVTELVNLSYELDDAMNAVDRDGEVVDARSIRAKIEVMKRLRKLAERQRCEVTPELIDEGGWSVNLLRTRYVEVPVDGSGRPIPRANLEP